MDLDISTDKWEKIAGNFCSDKWKDESDDWNDIEIIERIGSESSEAEVYRIRLQGQEYAGKIMPINSIDSFEKNENEISIAKELSGLPYFPIVYAGGFCKNTKYNEKSLFLEDSYKYFLFENLCDGETKACKTRMKHKYKTFSVHELQKIFDIHVDVSSHVLISEIAFSDLRQLCRYYTVDEKMWKFIIVNVLRGIKYLNDRKIIHGDLHCGNVLIKINDKNEIENTLIHDFGKSRRGDANMEDVEKFFYDLILNLDVPKNIKDILTTLQYKNVEEIISFLK